jgi:protein phosphatase
LEAYGNTTIGKVRLKNEDSFIISGFEKNSASGFTIVADGIGGAKSGDIASNMAVDIISGFLKTLPRENFENGENDEIEAKILAAITKANSEIYKRAVSDFNCLGMGTTVVVCHVAQNFAKIANVGDSRAYLVKSGEIARLTVDHSITQEMIFGGLLTEKESRAHPQKHYITRALGISRTTDEDFYECAVEKGDRMIVCTDGLTEMLGDDEILKFAKKYKRAKTLCQKLIEEADKRGGRDNTTVCVINI